MGPNVIVYTANFGGKDVFKEPKVVAEGVRYVYYTDQYFQSDTWEVHRMSSVLNSTILSKWYKMHPHELFPGETTLWMDANLISIKDPTALTGCENMLVETHLHRCCAYQEAEYCIRKKKGDKEDLLRQMADYRRLEYPRGYGLFTNRVIVRQPTEAAIEVNKLWWKHIVGYSTRDQVSLPYVLRDLSLSIDTIDHQEMKTYFLKKGGHRFR